jgi:polyvinyl alcohol dehydrogenase (cytochrome)
MKPISIFNPYFQLNALAAMVLVIFFSLVAACKPLPPQVRLSCEDSINTSIPIDASGFGFDLHNTRNASTSTIDSSNVKNLVLDHAFVDPDTKEKRGAVAVAGAVTYLSGTEKVYAINQHSGCVYWQYEAGEIVRGASILLADDSQLNKRVVYIGTYFGNVVALDAATGNKIWETNAVPEVPFYPMITGGLQYYDGKLIAPIASKQVLTSALEPLCCTTHGLLVVLNAADGNILWRKHMTDEAQLQLDSRYRGPNGVSIWSTPLVDAERQQILVSTSSNFTRPATETENAVMALDIDSGAVNWIFQGTFPDFSNAGCGLKPPLDKNCDYPNNDFDMITPILTVTPSGKDVVITADKSGTVFSLQPETGELNWSNRLGAGSKLGGVHWGMAVDENKVYASITDISTEKVAALDILLGFDFFNGLTDATPVPALNAQPGIYALDLETGAVKWKVRNYHTYKGLQIDSIYSAALSVSNDVLFAGSLDGVVKAFHTDTGEELWSFDSAIAVTGKDGFAGNGGTIDSVGPIAVKDALFLNSGYSSFGLKGKYNGGPGNALFIFRLAGE